MKKLLPGVSVPVRFSRMCSNKIAPGEPFRNSYVQQPVAPRIYFCRLVMLMIRDY
jgi:hypothetical protein